MRLTIDRLGHLGDGVARGPDGPVYAPHTLPGEDVEGEPFGDFIAEPQILSPSPYRVKPPCPHFGACGGCALQHADDGFVAAWKQSVVVAALAAHGLSAPFRPPVTSPPRTRRRAVLRVWSDQGQVCVGYLRARAHQLVAIGDCHVLHPRIIEAFPALAEIARSLRPALTMPESRSVHVTLADEGLDVAVMGVSFPRGADTMRFAPLLLGSGIARLTFGAELVFQTSAPTLRIGRARVRLQPAGFLQATVEGEAALAASVAEAVSGAKRVIDLFAGIGTFALRMAEKAEVHAADGDRDAIAALTAAWRGAPGLRRLTAEARDLFRRPLEAEELRGADAIVIDPPRAGAEAQTAALARAGVPVIAAVSCNPVTFARDAKALVRAGYRIDWVQPVDQFRWSPHLELAARFSLPGA